MSEFHIVLEDEARRNVDATYSWIAERSPDGARRWYRAFLKALDKLTNDPDRLPDAPESHHFGETVRNLSFRMRSGRTYRVLFTVVGNDVHILYIRAPGQDLAEP